MEVTFRRSGPRYPRVSLRSRLREGDTHKDRHTDIRTYTHINTMTQPGLGASRVIKSG